MSIYILLLGFVLCISSIFLIIEIFKKSIGSGKQVEISNIIKEASFVYLIEQYKVIWFVSILLGFVIKYIFGNVGLFFFIFGITASTIVSFVSMYISVNSNVRTVEAAKDSLKSSFSTVFLASVASATFISSIAIILLSFTLYISTSLSLSNNLICLSVGVSLTSVFARLGGGIFTKGADVGADMVGKIENSMAEDDMRNPAVIADNVGDNVGDCAGMTADLLESIVVSISSLMIINKSNNMFNNIFLILFIIGIISNLIGYIVTKFFLDEKNCNQNINIFNFVSLSSIGLLTTIFSNIISIHKNNFLSFFVGLIASYLVLKFTEYYTSSEYSVVKEAAEVSKYGSGSNVIFGLAIGFESIFAIVIIVIIGIGSCYLLNGLIGLSFGIIGIMSSVTTILTQDLLGPIVDNAGGIAEMSGLDESIRERTDTLDTLGNTTKAITKGYAIVSALFASIIMFYLFTHDLSIIRGIKINLSLDNPLVIFGLLLGGSIPFLFSSIAMKSVGNAASEVVKEVREQIQKNPLILTGEATPNYNNTVKYLTRFSINSMILPALLPILIPLLGYYIGQYFENNGGFIMLGVIILGTTIIGSLLSITMIISGGLWDNAKKYIESLGLKKTEQYKSAVTGDTVGDPYKDTSGPTLNSVIKLVNLVGILILYLI